MLTWFRLLWLGLCELLTFRVFAGFAWLGVGCLVFGVVCRLVGFGLWFGGFGVTVCCLWVGAVWFNLGLVWCLMS